ncbi:hypothetical protein V6N13_032171 [Hibiscus sabdariffa]
MLLEHEFPLDVVHCRKAWPYEGEDNLAKVFSGKVTPSSNVSEDESLEREMDETHNVEDDELELRYSLSEADASDIVATTNAPLALGESYFSSHILLSPDNGKGERQKGLIPLH